MTYEQWIDLIRAELFIALPFMALLTLFALRLALRHRDLGSPWLLFFACALAGADATWIAGASWYHDNVGPLPDWALVLNALATTVNAHLPFIVIAYFAARSFSDWLPRDRDLNPPPAEGGKGGEGVGVEVDQVGTDPAVTVDDTHGHAFVTGAH